MNRPQVPPKPTRNTIRLRLRAMGMRSVRAVKKPLLSKRHVQQRLQFARKFRHFRWGKTIFSDEKIFRVRPGGKIRFASKKFRFRFSLNAFRLRCWVQAGASKYTARYTIRTVQKAEGLMVWAAMKSNGTIWLRRCPPKVDSAAYQSILGSALSFIRPRYVFHPC